MNKIQLYNVSPSMPTQLSELEVIANNMWWCWNTDAIELLRRIDPKLWNETGHNPPLYFSQIPQTRLEDLAEDDSFMSHYNLVLERFNSEVRQGQDGNPHSTPPECIAYFSLEYGLHESIKFYSGGLGCLAGDHLKESSDMDLPMVAVGLLYRCGYFQQYLNSDGWQQEACLINEIHHLPLKKACDNSHQQVKVSIPLPNGELHAIVWQLDVGRIPLYLLDTNIPENHTKQRNVAFQLYEADREVRLQQEILLGIGGFRALLALGYNPAVCHMNEGHAAFVSLARMDHLMKSRNADIQVAEEIVRRTNIFTTHTPVPAGNETFAVEPVKSYLSALQKEINIDPAKVVSWGRAPDKEHSHELVMTILALRMSNYSNAVSKLHGGVTRRMWSHLWQGKPENEIPITHVTNGVHTTSWLSQDNVVLFDRYLGPDWRNDPSNPEILERVDMIPDEELWHAHEIGRSRLVRTARDLGEKQMSVRNAAQAEIREIKSVLHHDALTIGFARRFAGYKRATLLLKNPAKLEALLTDKKRPIQLVFAGKAHPADNVGKELIHQIVTFASNHNVRHRIIFLENYDIRIARYLVQGVDVWLNTPRRPEEASGTSGMKAAINGGLHASILDGWWDEGFTPEAGWAIGGREKYDNHDYQDMVESQALYNLLENTIIPLFYDRPEGDIPVKWIKMMRASIRMALGYFTSHRMVSEYNNHLYQPALQEMNSLLSDDMKRARELVAQRNRLQALWKNVSLSLPITDRDISVMHVGDKFNVTTSVSLGELRPDEVDVQVYHGLVDSNNRIISGKAGTMVPAEDKNNGHFVYHQEIVCDKTGRYGLTARVTPKGNDWNSIIPGFITWADGQ